MTAEPRQTPGWGGPVLTLSLLALGAALSAEVLGRAMGWGALGPGPRDQGHGNRGRVALTFDDGPSARTPELLRVLAAHGVHATFFVTEPACRQFPAELAALREAGHQLESHGRWHTHALLLAPWREWAQVAWHPEPDRPAPAGHLYRPPYGGHSPLTRLLAWALGRRVALWDTEGRDWTAGSAAELAGQTLRRTRPGSVVLLHDGPAVTPDLLDRLLRGLRAAGLTPVRLSELPMHRIGAGDGWRRLWQSYGR